MELSAARITIMKLFNSLDGLRTAVDSTVAKLNSVGRFELADRVALNYPLLEKQLELANELALSLVDKADNTTLTDNEVETINSISHKIAAISGLIKDDSYELIEELTTGKKLDKMYH